MKQIFYHETNLLNITSATLHYFTKEIFFKYRFSFMHNMQHTHQNPTTEKGEGKIYVINNS